MGPDHRVYDSLTGTEGPAQLTGSGAPSSDEVFNKTNLVRLGRGAI